MRAKMKTCKAVTRRFKITGTGKLTYHKGGRRHLLTNKPAKRMRPLRRRSGLAAVEHERVMRLMPYGQP